MKLLIGFTINSSQISSYTTTFSKDVKITEEFIGWIEEEIREGLLEEIRQDRSFKRFLYIMLAKNMKIKIISVTRLEDI